MNGNLQEQSVPHNFIQPGQLQTVIVHAEMTLKELEGSTVLHAMRDLGEILALHEESIAVVTIGVNRITLVPITLHHR